MTPRNAAKSHFYIQPHKIKAFFAQGSYILYTEVHENRFSIHRPGHGTNPWEGVFAVLEVLAIISIKRVKYMSSTSQ